MKISKLFHWLYTILMLLPFGFLIFNALASMWSGNVISNANEYFISYFSWLGDLFNEIGLIDTIGNVYDYLVFSIFGIDLNGIGGVISNLLTYWTCISIIWLVFDVFMYVPLLVHRWIDKAKLE